MKTIATLLLFLATALPAAAQETLFEGDLTHGGWIGPVAKAAYIDGAWGLLAGGAGGWLVNHQVTIGLAAYGLATTNMKADFAVDGTRPTLQVGYGGLLLGYAVNPDDVLHITVQSLIGGGAISYSMLDSKNDEIDRRYSFGSDEYFIAEPEVGAELNVAGNLRVEATVGYRFVGGLDYRGLKSSDLSGPSAGLTVKFGEF